ncbi:MAG: PDZ domain-containing protein [Lachnospiraceae bacterium]|nr:PDZ domain-containing protein [Lachnospiraceae bacterium]MBQ9580202.1 PDZ domain-containing protein [Lachnospiraceae bacterium]
MSEEKFEQEETKETEENLQVIDIDNMDMAVEEVKKPRRNKEFGKGVFAGVVLCLLIVSLAGLMIFSTLRKNGYTISELKVDKELTAGILSEQVENKISNILSILSTYYYDDIDTDIVAEGMFKGMVDSLGDKYTNYYTEEEYQEFIMSTAGVYYGIGALLSQDKTTLVITIDKVYKNSPAEEAGLMAGDIILSANGVSSEGVEVSNFVNNIRGEEGTTVDIVVKRGEEELTFTCTRRKVDIPTIEYTMFDNKIGYIQITQFDEVTGPQFSDALKDLKKQGMKALIVDLRGNPGGLLTTVTDILDEILPKGMLVYTENKYGKREEYTSDSNELGLPLCVLINGTSASASEIFAGAVKDYEYGTLIGTNTYGKGIVQVIVPMKDGTAIKVTTSRYYTPNGNYIHGVGIAPDIELEYEFLGGENDLYDYKYDNQINKAIEVLNSKLNN